MVECLTIPGHQRGETERLEVHKNTKDITGQKFGRLTAIKPLCTKSSNRNTHWLCLCDCGRYYTSTQSSNLKNGTVRSCGCWNTEVTRKRNYKHGHSIRRKVTAEYKAYTSARWRCNCKKGRSYKDYGGRGIKFLFTSFSQFLKVLGKRPSSTHSLDRKNNNGHYEPKNVRWATPTQQVHNRRNPIAELKKRVRYLERKLEKCRLSHKG